MKTEIHLLFTSTDPEAASWVCWRLFDYLTDHGISGLRCDCDDVEAVGEESLREFFAQMPIGYSFHFLAENPRVILESFFQVLHNEFGSDLQVIGPWTERDGVVTLAVGKL